MSQKETQNEIKLPKHLLTILRICFYFNVLGLVTFVTFPVIIILKETLFPNFDIVLYFIIIGYVGFPVTIFLVYCFYFYYKYDRYSSSGIKLFFLNWLYAPFYFYKVIWKRKRKLIGSYQREPVIGNTIHVESCEEEKKIISP